MSERALFSLKKNLKTTFQNCAEHFSIPQGWELSNETNGINSIDQVKKHWAKNFSLKCFSNFRTMFFESYQSNSPMILISFEAPSLTECLKESKF